MIKAIAAVAFAVCPMLAHAAPVTYSFRGFVEHAPNAPGVKPANYDTLIPVTIVLNDAIAGRASGDTETYGNTCNTPGGGGDPILAVILNGKRLAPGSCEDSVTITRASGQSSVTIFLYAMQVGAVTLAFKASSENAVASLSIPAKIDTLQFDTANFSSSYPAFSGAGALATKQ